MHSKITTLSLIIAGLFIGHSESLFAAGGGDSFDSGKGRGIKRCRAQLEELEEGQVSTDDKPSPSKRPRVSPEGFGSSGGGGGGGPTLPTRPIRIKQEFPTAEEAMAPTTPSKPRSFFRETQGVPLDLTIAAVPPRAVSPAAVTDDPLSNARALRVEAETLKARSDHRGALKKFQDALSTKARGAHVLFGKERADTLIARANLHGDLATSHIAQIKVQESLKDIHAAQAFREHAIKAFSQALEDLDEALGLEDQGLPALREANRAQIQYLKARTLQKRADLNGGVSGEAPETQAILAAFDAALGEETWVDFNRACTLRRKAEVLVALGQHAAANEPLAEAIALYDSRRFAVDKQTIASAKALKQEVLLEMLSASAPLLARMEQAVAEADALRQRLAEMQAQMSELEAAKASADLERSSLLSTITALDRRRLDQERELAGLRERVTYLENRDAHLKSVLRGFVQQ